MDNNPIVPPSGVPGPNPPATATPATPSVATSPTPPVATGSKGSSNKLWIILVIVALLVVAAVAGYMLMNKSSSTPVTQQPAAIDVSDLNQDLNNVNENDLSSDFASVDSDLNSL